MLCGRYPIRVSLVADTSHILEVSRKDNMDATMAIKGELEGVVFVAAGNDIFPVTRVGDSEADWVGDIVNSGRQGWQCQRQSKHDCRQRREGDEEPSSTGM